MCNLVSHIAPDQTTLGLSQALWNPYSYYKMQ